MVKESTWKLSETDVSKPKKSPPVVRGFFVVLPQFGISSKITPFDKPFDKLRKFSGRSFDTPFRATQDDFRLSITS
jgi:hypothetical protein